jgi:hypothetical protein
MIINLKIIIITIINISESCLAILTSVIQIIITFSTTLIQNPLSFASYLTSSSLFPIITVALFFVHSFINLIIDFTAA